MPTYNHANFLRLAILSVINQTYKAWEMIIVDNHSQDETVQVVQGFNDSRITLLQINNNGVIGASRNKGIHKSKGEWVAFLDSDDLWAPNKLEVFFQSLYTDNEFDVWSADEYYVDAYHSIRRQLRYGPYKKSFYSHLLRNGNCLSPSATLVRRQFMFDHNIFFRENIEFVTAEDYDFWLNLTKAGARFKFMRQILGEFTIHENNNSKRLEMHKVNTLNVIQDHVFNIQEFDDNKAMLWRDILSRRQFIDGLISLRNGDWQFGIKTLAESINTSPLSCTQELFWLAQKSLLKLGFK